MYEFNQNIIDDSRLRMGDLGKVICKFFDTEGIQIFEAEADILLKEASIAIGSNSRTNLL